MKAKNSLLLTLTNEIFKFGVGRKKYFFMEQTYDDVLLHTPPDYYMCT